jgi:hypothetical protein
MNFQEMFGSSAIILIVVGLVIACIAFLGWCGNCCGGYNVIRILVSITVILFLVIYFVDVNIALLVSILWYKVICIFTIPKKPARIKRYFLLCEA